jgi:hypothetical protein
MAKVEQNRRASHVVNRNSTWRQRINAENRACSPRKFTQTMVSLRIPMKPAMHSKLKPAARSDLKPAIVPI